MPVKFISKWNLQQVPDKNLFKKELRRILGKFDEHIFDAIDVDIKNHIEELANQTLDHDFDFLGSGKVHLNPINWHQDFKSGFIWPKGIFYRRYQKTDLSNNADVKVPWELSRCHHLLWLGEAYLLTKEEKYAKEVVFQIEDWIEENPLMYSINWTCAMDVSIRAVNWLFAVNMILSSKSVTDKFISKINKSLYQHGFFIFNNLEKTIPYSANHYAANLAGLLYLGQLFKNTKKGKKWFDFALSEYYHEIRTQVLPSGIHFEKSISYHRLMTELFSYPVYMLFRLDIQIPVDIISRIQSMYNFIHSYIKPNGNAPLIGDNDDGRFLPFLKYNFLKHGYLLDCSSVDNNIISHGVGYKFKVKCSNIKSYLYDDAGFAILRKNSSYVFFSNSDESKFPTYNSIIGTHTHNDNLSFEFSIDEQDIIIDPGSFLYTSDIAKRNVFRSIKKHNSITVDSEELNILLDTHAFSVIKNSVIDKVTINDCNNSILCKGSYT
ncbi:MAG: heparinase II/III family protein, partial [Peptococcales bacterium]